MIENSKRIVFVLDQELAIYFADSTNDRYLILESVRFNRYLPELTDCAFYDWWSSAESITTSLEVHIAMSDFGDKVAKNLQDLNYVSVAPFPIIQINEGNGSPLGLEAFGDLMFFCNNDDTLAIVVSPEWIPAPLMSSIAKLAMQMPQ